MVLSPKHISDAVLFLASNDLEFVIGHDLVNVSIIKDHYFSLLLSIFNMFNVIGLLA